MYDSEYEIVSAIANDQLYRRGINGRGVKIMSYAPYKASTIISKKRKHQPYTRVTLFDEGDFHSGMHVVFTEEYPGGFYITSDDYKTEALVEKYGPEIFRLTDKNFTRIVKTHIRKKLQKLIRQRLKTK